MKTKLATIEFIGQSPALLDHCGAVLARVPQIPDSDAVVLLAEFAKRIGVEIDWKGSEVSKPE